ALSLNKSSSSDGGDVHQGFQSLLTELNKSDTQYLLRTANRVFGEKSYDFLSMVLMGAKGTTAVQMTQALSLNKSSSSGGGDVHQGFQSLLTELNKMDTEYLLRTANRLFGEKSYDFLSSFKDSCQNLYQAEMEELDFLNATEESRKHINTWVAKKTE
ncbi:Hypothetical predicted protein, partial [Marmota monax]